MLYIVANVVLFARTTALNLLSILLKCTVLKVLFDIGAGFPLVLVYL